MTMLAGAHPSVDVAGVTLGVDTHADTHVAGVIDFLGRHLGQASCQASGSEASRTG